MSSSAAKKDEAQRFAETVDLPAPTPGVDRELGLSQNFQDPSLEDLMPNLAAESATPVSVMHETVEAVQELLGEAQNSNSGEAQASGGSSIDLSSDFGEFNLQLSPEASPTEPMAPAAPVPSGAQLQFLTPSGDADAVPSFNVDSAPDGVAADSPPDSVEFEPSVMLTVAPGQQSDLAARGQVEMAEKLFQLVVCEYSFDDLVEAALSAIMGALDAQAGSVLEQDHDQQNYFFRCSIGGGDPEKVKAFRVPFHKGIVGHVGESRQSVLLRDLEEDQKQMRAISMSVGFEAKTCMAAPILVGGQLYGVIELFNRRQGGFFSETDLQAFEAGTRMFAKVLEVRFLMAELMRRES